VAGGAGSARPRPRGPARWQMPDVDAAALTLARQVRRAIASLTPVGRARWAPVLEPLAEPLEDGDLADVRMAASRVRAAFGVGESVAEDLPDDEALALRDAADGTLGALARHDTRRGRDVADGAR
jgi:hypothetical protein